MKKAIKSTSLLLVIFCLVNLLLAGCSTNTSITAESPSSFTDVNASVTLHVSRKVDIEPSPVTLTKTEVPTETFDKEVKAQKIADNTTTTTSAPSVQMTNPPIREGKEINVSSPSSVCCSYCGDPNHLYAYCTQRTIDNGGTGRWSIPSVGVNVGCYSSSRQSVCDAADSACYFSVFDQWVIADHYYQGFDGIKSCNVGTVAYMDKGAGEIEYVCTDIIHGYNTGHGLTDLEGNELDDLNPDGITCYTCNAGSDTVTIVFFGLPASDYNDEADSAITESSTETVSTADTSSENTETEDIVESTDNNTDSESSTKDYDYMLNFFREQKSKRDS